jgi:hypothetical protein
MPRYYGDKIKEVEMGRACGMWGGEGKCRLGFSGETEGKRPLVRPRHRWLDSIIGLTGMGHEGMDLIHVA